MKTQYQQQLDDLTTWSLWRSKKNKDEIKRHGKLKEQLTGEVNAEKGKETTLINKIKDLNTDLSNDLKYRAQDEKNEKDVHSARWDQFEKEYNRDKQNLTILETQHDATVETIAKNRAAIILARN